MTTPAATSPPSLATQILRYSVIGAFNTMFGFTLILGLYAAGTGVLIANVAGYAICWSVAFAFNRGWTFEDGRKLTFDRLAAWTAVMIASLAANIALVATLMGTGVPFAVAQLVGCLAYSILAFLGARHVVFARSS